MSLPGFTAEASLYKISVDYHQVRSGISAMPDPSQTVSPQLLSSSRKFCWLCEQAGGDCICTPHGCYCI
jgi:hypothetical protein